jgi:carnitine monooxygenase subunit
VKSKARIALATRIDQLVTAKTTDMAEAPYIQPTSRYVDADWLTREKDRLFRLNPHVLGAATRIPEAGDFFTVDIGEVPLLVVRGADGRIRTFLNIC